jgi:hypothetical protein
MGLVEAVMCQPSISIARELGDSNRLCSGRATASAMRVSVYDGLWNVEECAATELDAVVDDVDEQKRMQRID